MSPLRVILIDDDHLARAILVEWLQDAGFQVMDFSEPREALGTFDSGRQPHVIITDVDLGSALNGFDIAEVAHQLWPAVSVIRVSGMPTGHTGQKLDPDDRYLRKPFSGDCLLQMLGQLTDRSWPVDEHGSPDERRCADSAHEAARNQSGPDLDDLAPARGIAVSVLVALALWLPIVATVLPDRGARSTWRGSASQWGELSLRPFDQGLPADAAARCRIFSSNSQPPC
jgi:CheY-like chemotaxis protein